jgi:hypothetical protein
MSDILRRLLTETWPAKAARSAFDALMLPGQVAGGAMAVQPSQPGMWSDVDEARTQANQQTMMGRANDLAGLVMGGSYAAPKPRGALTSGFSDPLYHGSPQQGLRELVPSDRGPLGPGVYTSPAPQIAGHYKPETGAMYQLPEKNRDIARGHGHNTDADWHGYKDDMKRLAASAEPEKRAEVQAIIDKMWSGDGYPMYQRLRHLYGGDEAAQALYKRAGFDGLSGQVDGPEVLLFNKQALR